METKWGRVEELGLVQRQAGVDREVEELTRAYARLMLDRGRAVTFYEEGAETAGRGEAERDYLCGWLARKNPGLDGRVLDFLRRYSRAMGARHLPVILSVRHLARKWRMSEARLRWMARNPERFCRVYWVRKKGGGERQIVAPGGKLLTVQRWILRRILDKVEPEKSAYGFVRGRSILDNAKRHVGQGVVMRLDVKDFFPSIRYREVRRVFERLGYPYGVASVLANVCTIRGALPQGAPTSPALSNLVCRRLDRRLSGLAKRLGFRYTRYADDLVFSSDDKRLPKLIPFLREVLKEEGFELNEGKIRVMREGERQMVTGLVVNERANVPREQRRRLRAALHRARVMGVEAVEWATKPKGEAVAAIRGHLAFWQMVDPGATGRREEWARLWGARGKLS